MQRRTHHLLEMRRHNLCKKRVIATIQSLHVPSVQDRGIDHSSNQRKRKQKKTLLAFIAEQNVWVIHRQSPRKTTVYQVWAPSVPMAQSTQTRNTSVLYFEKVSTSTPCFNFQSTTFKSMQTNISATALGFEAEALPSESPVGHYCTTQIFRDDPTTPKQPQGEAFCGC